MEYNILGRTGLKVSQMGLGGAPLGGDFGEISDSRAIEVVHQALDLGINFIDTAPLYGRGESERRIGIALQGRRNSVILASKAVMRGEPYTYENTIVSVEQSLRRLQTNVIDLLQIHEPNQTTFDQIMNETVPALLKLKEQGKIRAIGINGRDLDLLRKYLSTGMFDTTQIFTRYMLIDYSAKETLLPLARKFEIGVINGSVLGMGLLSDTPAAFLLKHPKIMEEVERRKQKLHRLGRSEPKGLIEPAMRFSLCCPDIHVTLTGTTSTRSLRMNASYADGRGLEPEVLEYVLSQQFDQPIEWDS